MQHDNHSICPQKLNLSASYNPLNLPCVCQRIIDQLYRLMVVDRLFLCPLKVDGPVPYIPIPLRQPIAPLELVEVCAHPKRVPPNSNITNATRWLVPVQKASPVLRTLLLPGQSQRASASLHRLLTASCTPARCSPQFHPCSHVPLLEQ